MSRPDKNPRRHRNRNPRERLKVVAQGLEPVEEPIATEPVTPATKTPAAPISPSPVAPRPRRTPRIAPHAARQANRARRTWFAFLFFPFFAIFVVLDAVREVRDRIARARGVQLEARPPFRRPDGMPEGDARSVADIAGTIESFPFRPARISTNAAFFRDHGPDALGALLSPNPQMTTIPHLYRKPFEQRLFTGHDGIQLAGMQAMHAHRGPAVVICHGLLMTKNFDAIIQIAKRAFELWGFHVVTLDLRGWGQSAWTSDAPASAGYFEGRDIIEVCRELHRDPRVTSVAGIGYSLGGASMLNAAHVSSQSDDTPLDGGTVCVSPPTVIDVALDHISTKPHWRDPFWGLWHVFAAAIKGNVRRRGLSQDVKTWRDLTTALSAPYYDVSIDEFCTRASAATFAHEITQPVLALHAADDFLVPVQHAYALQDAVVDNPWVHVLVRDAGAHISFGAVDPSWYHSALRRWLEYWAVQPNQAPEDAPID